MNSSLLDNTEMKHSRADLHIHDRDLKFLQNELAGIARNSIW